jgi:hypothetical protein
VAETTRKHNAEPVFAIEVDPSSSDLSEKLAEYRRLPASQKAAIAAELRRKVVLEIAEERPVRRRRTGPPRHDGPLSRVKSAFKVLAGVVFTGSKPWHAKD